MGCNCVYVSMPARGVWRHAPQEISCISGPLRFILMHYEGRKYYGQVYLIVNKDSGNRQADQTINTHI